MKNRILTIIVILALLLSLFSVVASAEDYTEWELSPTGHSLKKNGDEVYTRVELDEKYYLANNLFVFENQVYIKDIGDWTTIYAEKKDANVVYLYYGDALTAYANSAGLKELERFFLGQLGGGGIYSAYKDYYTPVTEEFVKDMIKKENSDGYGNATFEDYLYANEYPVEAYSEDGVIAYSVGSIFVRDNICFYIGYAGPLRTHNLTNAELLQFSDYLERMKPSSPNYTYEGDESGLDSDLGFEFDKPSAMAVLVILIIIMGILLPAVPIIISLIKLFKSRVAYPLPYYILFITSVIWCVLGITGLIILLV